MKEIYKPNKDGLLTVIKYYSLPEVSKMLGISYAYVLRISRKNSLKVTYIGKHKYVEQNYFLKMQGFILDGQELVEAIIKTNKIFEKRR